MKRKILSSEPFGEVKFYLNTILLLRKWRRDGDFMWGKKNPLFLGANFKFQSEKFI